VTDWIKDQGADIVALQELGNYTSGKLEEDARIWGHSHSVLLKTTGYSVAITSRYPIEVREKILAERGSFPGRILGAVNSESEEELVSRLERIDYILASPHLSVKCSGAKVCNGPENYYLSDHYPFVVQFDLSGK
jgi:exonuclease III